MPHIIVQSSPNVIIPDTTQLLQQLTTTLWNTGHFGKPQDIKARMINVTDSFIGIDDDQSNEAFVYLQLRLMPGRSDDARRDMADQLLAQLQQQLSDKQQEAMPIQYAVEVLELSQVYKKIKC